MGTQADLRGCFTTRSFNKNRPFLRFCSVIRRAARLSKLDSASSQSVGSRLKELGARLSLSYTICSSLLLDLTHKLVRNIIVVAGFFFLFTAAFVELLCNSCTKMFSFPVRGRHNASRINLYALVLLPSC